MTAKMNVCLLHARPSHFCDPVFVNPPGRGCSVMWLNILAVFTEVPVNILVTERSKGWFHITSFCFGSGIATKRTIKNRFHCL